MAIGKMLESSCRMVIVHVIDYIIVACTYTCSLEVLYNNDIHSTICMSKALHVNYMYGS